MLDRILHDERTSRSSRTPTSTTTGPVPTPRGKRIRTTASSVNPDDLPQSRQGARDAGGGGLQTEAPEPLGQRHPAVAVRRRLAQGAVDDAPGPCGAGRRALCLVGVDLSAKLDLTALVALFPPPRTSLAGGRCAGVWTPADTLAERAHRDRAPYPLWRDGGYLHTTPGTRVDHQVIRTALVELRAFAHIQAIGFDPWHADQLIDQLTTPTAFRRPGRRSPANLHGHVDRLPGAPSRGARRPGRLRGDPLITWAVGNAVVQRDGKDNIYPLKKRSAVGSIRSWRSVSPGRSRSNRPSRQSRKSTSEAAMRKDVQKKAIAPSVNLQVRVPAAEYRRDLRASARRATEHGRLAATGLAKAQTGKKAVTLSDELLAELRRHVGHTLRCKRETTGDVAGLCRRDGAAPGARIAATCC